MNYQESLKYLGLNFNYTKDELRKKFRFLAKEYHPDTNINKVGSEEKFKELNLAYHLLLKRLENDKLIKNEEDLIILKNQIILEIKELKDKYSYKEVYDFGIKYLLLLSKINNLRRVLILKDKFEKEKSILLKEIILPKKKQELYNTIDKFKERYGKYVREISIKYLKLLLNVNEIDNLEKLKFDFLKEIHEEYQREIDGEKLLGLKDKIKRIIIYNFYINSIDKSMNRICLNYDLLKEAFTLLSIVDSKNIKEIITILEKIDYDYPVFEKSKLDLFYLKYLGRIYFKDLDKVDSLKPRVIVYENEKGNSELNLKLNKFYYYATIKNISLNELIDFDFASFLNENCEKSLTF